MRVHTFSRDDFPDLQGCPFDSADDFLKVTKENNCPCYSFDGEKAYWDWYMSEKTSRLFNRILLSIKLKDTDNKAVISQEPIVFGNKVFNVPLKVVCGGETTVFITWGSAELEGHKDKAKMLYEAGVTRVYNIGCTAATSPIYLQDKDGSRSFGDKGAIEIPSINYSVKNFKFEAFADFPRYVHRYLLEVVPKAVAFDYRGDIKAILDIICDCWCSEYAPLCYSVAMSEYSNLYKELPVTCSSYDQFADLIRKLHLFTSKYVGFGNQLSEHISSCSNEFRELLGACGLQGLLLVSLYFLQDVLLGFDSVHNDLSGLTRVFTDCFGDNHPFIKVLSGQEVELESEYDSIYWNKCYAMIHGQEFKHRDLLDAYYRKTGLADGK